LLARQQLQKGRGRRETERNIIGKLQVCIESEKQEQSAMPEAEQSVIKWLWQHSGDLTKFS